MIAETADPRITRRTIEHRGKVAELRLELEAAAPTDSVLEYLVEGPRGTGKSNGVAYLLWKLCRRHKNVRSLVIRTSRSLLTDTFCKTYEEDVCPEHTSISRIARTQRHEYVFPATNSRIVLGGLDDQQRYYGSDWDIIVPEEAVQFTWKELEPFLGSLRNGKLPFHAIIYPTNPDAPGNWLNKRAEAGICKRMRCRHRDNPSLWDLNTNDWTPKGRNFMGSLQRYTGAAYKRHVLGEWAGAEGMVWDNFDPEVHIIDGPPPGIIEYRASIDWGSTHPGCLQVWGIDGKKRMTMVAEVYRSKMNTDWWAGQAVELARMYNIRRIVCDPSYPMMIDTFNSWLREAGVRPMAYKADNRKASTGLGDMGGLGLVRWGLERDDEGIPRIRFVRGALLGGADPELVAIHKPTCTVQEIPGYAHARDATGEILLEQTDKRLPDDGCDALRYEATDNWRREPEVIEPEPYVYPEWTNAGMFGTPESLERDSIRRMQGEDDGNA